MKVDKSLASGSTSLLILKLLSIQDMYGYKMIEELERRSENAFELKAGTLYPLLHKLEQQKFVTSYERKADNQKLRKYYQITDEGRKALDYKQKEWKLYIKSVKKVLGGECIEPI